MIFNTQIAGGVGESGDMSDPICFFDYDGTLVASYSSVPASLPDVPIHNNLKDGTWNYTLQQIATQFDAVGTCDVGANYNTVSGKTEIDIELVESSRLKIEIRCAPNGTVKVDWGDGTSTSTITGVSITSSRGATHTYAQIGKYTITLELTSGTEYALNPGTSAYTLLGKPSGSSMPSYVYASQVKAIRVGPSCSIADYAFHYLSGLESISLPGDLSSIGGYAFQGCYSFKYITIPSNVTSIKQSEFWNCTTMRRISLPINLDSLVGSAFYQCYTLARISLPNSLTSIGSSAFSSCKILHRVVIPSSTTSIGDSAFRYCDTLASVTIDSATIGAAAFSSCYGLGAIHFKAAIPPACSNSDAWTNVPTDCKIYVPIGTLSTYKSAQNYPKGLYTYIEE